MSQIYTVKGMTCDHCKSSVTESVTAVSGVEGVEVDVASGRLAVAGEGVDAASIRAAVEQAGYEIEA